jgi:hypothetical protein
MKVMQSIDFSDLAAAAFKVNDACKQELDKYEDLGVEALVNEAMEKYSTVGFYAAPRITSAAT